MVVNVDIAEDSVAGCISGTTTFHLTNCCGDVGWRLTPTNAGGAYIQSIDNGGCSMTVNNGTNCGMYTITAFHTVYTNMSCTSDTAALFVVDIDSQCVATTPTNQARTNIGVGELVDLSAWGTPPGTVTWTTSDGTLSTTNGTSTRLTAPCYAANPVTVTVNFSGGSCDKPFTVIEPDGVISKTNCTDGSYGVNVAGSGMWIDLWLLPTNVSFGAVWVMEVGCISTNASGYFADTNVWPADKLDHSKHGANNPIPVDADNYIAEDHASTGVCPQPWSSGHYTWPIPAIWWITGCSSNSLPWSDHDATIDGSGTVSVSKFGHTVTRSANDVYTTFY